MWNLIFPRRFPFHWFARNICNAWLLSLSPSTVSVDASFNVRNTCVAYCSGRDALIRTGMCKASFHYFVRFNNHSEVKNTWFKLYFFRREIFPNLTDQYVIKQFTTRIIMKKQWQTRKIYVMEFSEPHNSKCKYVVIEKVLSDRKTSHTYTSQSSTETMWTRFMESICVGIRSQRCYYFEWIGRPVVFDWCNTTKIFT